MLSKVIIPFIILFALSIYAQVTDSQKILKKKEAFIEAYGAKLKQISN